MFESLNLLGVRTDLLLHLIDQYHVLGVLLVNRGLSDSSTCSTWLRLVVEGRVELSLLTCPHG